MKRAAAIAAATLTATLAAAPAASAYITLGSGTAPSPGMSVDQAGTAYIAWNGAENPNAPLHFCRLPRGAKACDAGVGATIASPGTSLSRPFITISGDRVVIVQHRYNTGNPFSAMFAYTSTNRGASFGPAKVVGKVAFHDAVAGPGDTMSGVSNNETAFQNVPTDGSAPVNLDGTSTVPWTRLSTTHLYDGAVGLVNASTPLAVFADGGGAGQFRRYSGSGSVNDAANWTAPEPIGYVGYPRLAGGSAGLVMISGDGNGIMQARKYNGSTFGAAVTIGPGSSPRSHLFQDAGGRLHAIYQSSDADGRNLTHAGSDDGGATWRKGRLESETSAGYEFNSLRVATAADHIGVAVWEGGPREVRVAALGPDAPAAAVSPPPPAVVPPAPRPVAPRPVLRPKPSLTASGSALRLKTRVRIRIKGELLPPAGIADAVACTGNVSVSFKRGDKLVVVRSLKIDKRCEFGFTAFVKKSKVKRAKKLALRIAFLGNAALAPVAKVGSVRVKG